MTLVVAIDGPAGAGKSSTAKALAARLGFRHVDTGAMYRVVGVLAHEAGVTFDDDAALEQLVDRLVFDEVGERIVVAGRDLTQAIRAADAGDWASKVSTRPVVRARLVALQRRLADGGPLVMEGRDIGTVVFPDADVKVYLDASPEERAWRRAHDPAHTGGPSAVAEVETALTARDELDRSRTASPLYAAADAIIIDTTGRSVDDVVARVLEVVATRM